MSEHQHSFRDSEVVIQPKHPKRNIFTIGAELPFVETLAEGLYRRYGTGLKLAQVRIFLPTRRSVRALRKSFLHLSNSNAVLLPKIQALGDIDDDELSENYLDTTLESSLLTPYLTKKLLQPVPHLTKQFLLTRLTKEWGSHDSSGPSSLAEASKLASELGKLLDQFQIAQEPLKNLSNLVPQQFADHWRKTVSFLNIIAKIWPEVLEERGFVDPIDRHNKMVRALVNYWQQRPPAYPIIAAGSTGSIKATADLLLAISKMPNGEVILPGFDQISDDETWASIDETHPQFSMKELVLSLGVNRKSVMEWPDISKKCSKARVFLMNKVMIPAAMTDRWLSIKINPESLTGLTRINFPGPREEAGAIAVIIREALVTTDKTVALVTPERNLARRVTAELQRWDISVDDSAGEPLRTTPAAIFLQLVAQMVHMNFAPVSLLAALKHPLAAGGQAPSEFRSNVQQLEKLALRGPRPKEGFFGLKGAIAKAHWRKKSSFSEKRKQRLTTWLQGIEDEIGAFEKIFKQGQQMFSSILSSHINFAIWLASTLDTPGEKRLWAGETGESLVNFLQEVDNTSKELGKIATQNYCELLEELLSSHIVRPNLNVDSRVSIWGPLEARLQQADLLILSGLNEGSWPSAPNTDPWLSRSIRKCLGLPSPEYKVGLSAHDFFQAVCAPEVILTRSRKIEGNSTIRSRWLVRLETLVGAPEKDELQRATNYGTWYRKLDLPVEIRPVDPPNFAPPLSVRPRKLSVSDVETLVNNPYEIFARRILDLQPLQELDSAPDAKARGIFVHDALHIFMKRYPDKLPIDAKTQLLSIGHRVLGEKIRHPIVKAFWLPAFARIASWFVDLQESIQASSEVIATETLGRYEFETSEGVFILTAKADRIDRRVNGGLIIIDYKTGSVPSWISVESGVYPQLALEALVAYAGGFKEVAETKVEELAFWKLGTASTAKVQNYIDTKNLIKISRNGLKQLIEKFNDSQVPYLANPWPYQRLNHNNYEHLSRYKEWVGSLGEDES